MGSMMENVTSGDTYCRISVDGVVVFEQGQEVEFLAGAVIAPMYSPANEQTMLPCLGPGESGVVAVFAQSLLNGVVLSEVGSITYGVSAEDWTAAQLVRLDQLALTDIGRARSAGETRIVGSARHAGESSTSDRLTHVTAFVFPTTAAGVPLRLFELRGPELAAGEVWTFEAPGVGLEFTGSLVHFGYRRAPGG